VTHYALPGVKTMATLLSGSGQTKRSTQQARGEHYCGPNEGEDAVDGDPKQAEGQQQQPHDRIEYQSQQGHGPAQDEEQAPEQEGDHEDTSSWL